MPDRLEMLVTSDPLAELDDALTRGAARLRAARTAGDTYTVERLAAWIDYWLDQRLAFRRDLTRESSHSS